MLLPFIVSLVGVLCGILISVINVYLVLMFRSQRRHQTSELTQFFYRFHLDAVIGIATCLYLGHVLTFYVFPEFFESTRLLVLWFGLLTSNLQMARMMYQFFISCDRVMAAFFPIEYRIYHPIIPIWPFFLFSLSTGLFQDFVFFYCCDFEIYVPKNCLALGCVMNKCYKTFWSTYQTVILSTIVLFSFAFCTRLFMWSKSTRSLTQVIRGKLSLTPKSLTTCSHCLPFAYCLLVFFISQDARTRTVFQEYIKDQRPPSTPVHPCLTCLILRRYVPICSKAENE